MTLKAAIQKIEGADVAAALRLVLDVWRKMPDPRLGDVLDALSQRIKRPPPTTGAVVTA